MKSYALTIMVCAPFLAAASCQSRTATEPCDLLVRMEPTPATAGYIVQNDRPFAQAVAMHRGRFERNRCG